MSSGTAIIVCFITGWTSHHNEVIYTNTHVTTAPRSTRNVAMPDKISCSGKRIWTSKHFFALLIHHTRVVVVALGFGGVCGTTATCTQPNTRGVQGNLRRSTRGVLRRTFHLVLLLLLRLGLLFLLLVVFSSIIFIFVFVFLVFYSSSLSLDLDFSSFFLPPRLRSSTEIP